MYNQINNQTSFGTRFNYYSGNKRVPGYVGRIVTSFENLTANSQNRVLNYNGHTKDKFMFSLSDDAGNVIAEKSFHREPTFLDHKSFKFMPHALRREKIHKRAEDLKNITFELEQIAQKRSD